MAVRMATAAVLKGLKTQAEQAETVICQLKHQIALLQTATALSCGREEEKRLKGENDALRAEIDKVKLSLMVAEIRNGVRQLPIPRQRNSDKPAAEGDVQLKPSPPPAPQGGGVKGEGGEQGAEPKTKKVKKEGGADDTGKPAKDDAKGKKKGAVGEGQGGAGGDVVEVWRLDLRVGRIVAVEKHPNADTLYVETVDLGEPEPRTIVSGLVEHVPIEQMRDRVAVFMVNLKASKMRGINSQGMIMCAKDQGKVEILLPPPGSVPGDCVTAQGFTGTPDKQLNPKKKVWETLKPDIKTDGQCVACYKESPFHVEGKGVVRAPTLPNAEIS